MTPLTHFELWLPGRLKCPTLFAGVTTAGQRRERVRQHIMENQLDFAVAGKRPDGKPECWFELFERVYGEAL